MVMVRRQCWSSTDSSQLKGICKYILCSLRLTNTTIGAKYSPEVDLLRSPDFAIRYARYSRYLDTVNNNPIPCQSCEYSRNTTCQIGETRILARYRMLRVPNFIHGYMDDLRQRRGRKWARNTPDVVTEVP